MSDIQRLEGIPPDEQRLIYAGRQLGHRGSDTLLVAEGVPENATLHLVLRLLDTPGSKEPGFSP